MSDPAAADHGPGPAPRPEELRAFVVLAEELQFRRAARVLGRAQSSLSAAIRRLEATLGVILFDRTSRHVALTPAGEQLVPAARRALAALEEVRTLAAVPPRPAPRPFRIGIEVPGLVELTAPVLRGFRGRHPGTRMVVREFSCAHGFLDECLDVAIVRTPLHDERLVAHPVATERRTYLLPHGHRLAGADELTMADVQDEPFVVIVPRARPARDYWCGLPERGGVLPRAGADAFTALEVVHGVVHLGALAIAVECCRSHLPDAVVVPAGDLSDNVVAVAHRREDDRPMVRDFLRIVRHAVAECGPLAPTLRAAAAGATRAIPVGRG